MAEYVTTAGYIDYWADLSIAPSDFDYKEAISIDLFKAELSQPVLSPANYDLGTYYKKQFDASLYEQIRYFDENPDLFEDITTESGKFKILNYQAEMEAVNSSNQKKRISPNAWLKLSSIALTYVGVNTYV